MFSWLLACMQCEEAFCQRAAWAVSDLQRQLDAAQAASFGPEQGQYFFCCLSLADVCLGVVFLVI